MGFLTAILTICLVSSALAAEGHFKIDGTYGDVTFDNAKQTYRIYSEEAYKIFKGDKDLLTISHTEEIYNAKFSQDVRVVGNLEASIEEPVVVHGVD
jgi:hypothetical protein